MWGYLKMDVSQYLEIFIDESNEHLQNLSDGIMILEKEPDNSDTINEIFRAAHSLKGMAGTMGYKRMQNLTHDMENVFSEVRNGNIKVDSRMVDVLFQCLDALEQYVDSGLRAFDCSGLMQWAFAKANINIGRSTYDQINAGVEVSINNIQPGDLLFYSNLGHVGMYIGNGQWIESPNTGKTVRITDVRWDSATRARRVL